MRGRCWPAPAVATMSILRYILIGPAIIGAIVVLLLAWWLVSPLFSDDEVVEPFPYSANAVVPRDMSQAQVEALMAEAAAAPEVLDVAAMPAAVAPGEAPVARLSGRFRDADAFHRGSGTADIYELGPGRYTLRLDTFKVTNGPDLRVLLAAAPDPEDFGDLTAAGYTELAPLKGNLGAQNYDLPADFDLSEAQSVVIFCHPFRVVFSVATLTPAPA